MKINKQRLGYGHYILLTALAGLSVVAGCKYYRTKKEPPEDIIKLEYKLEKLEKRLLDYEKKDKIELEYKLEKLERKLEILENYIELNRRRRFYGEPRLFRKKPQRYDM